MLLQIIIRRAMFVDETLINGSVWGGGARF